MAVATDDFAAWIDQAAIPNSRLTPQLEALLRAAFRFRQQQGSDYYSTRLLSHFLLHCDCGLKVAQVARLLGISRPNASRQQDLSSKQAIKQAHHRMAGRSHGKLLPRFAGPIAAFLVGHRNASRAELIDFVDRTFGIRVTRVGLHKFLKKYGLDKVPAVAERAAQGNTAVATAAPPPVGVPAATGAAAGVVDPAKAVAPASPAAPPFSSRGRNTPAPSC